MPVPKKAVLYNLPRRLKDQLRRKFIVFCRAEHSMNLKNTAKEKLNCAVFRVRRIHLCGLQNNKFAVPVNRQHICRVY